MLAIAPPLSPLLPPPDPDAAASAVEVGLVVVVSEEAVLEPPKVMGFVDWLGEERLKRLRVRLPAAMDV